MNDHSASAGQHSTELHTGVDGTNDQGKAGTNMAADGLSPSDRPTNEEVTMDASTQTEPCQMQPPPSEMHRFLQLPPEIRLTIWDMAMGNAKYAYSRYSPTRTYGCVQRFRFNLVYDAARVKPGQDKARGWVACFTPLKINKRPYGVFLRVCFETREIMLRKLSILTVHELPPADDYGHRAAPRKCHIPFDFNKDDFCVEGITHGLELAKEGKDMAAIWDPNALPLDVLLDNAFGLRFAPRIKRFAIIPHYEDVSDVSANMLAVPHLWYEPVNFILTKNGRNMATLAKRFPALVKIRSGTPCGFRRPPSLWWESASLRGRRQGGPSRMSKEERNRVYVHAWHKLFCHRYVESTFYDGWDCLL